MPNGHTTSQSVDVLGQRVSTLEVSMVNIDRKIDTIGSKLDDRGRTNWQVVIGFASLLVAIGVGLYTFVFTPFQNALTGNTTAIVKLSEKIDENREKDRDKYATKEDVEYRLVISGKRRDEQFADIVKRLDKNEQRQRDDAAKIVPRGENEEHWRSTDRDVSGLQRQIDQLRADQGSTYGVRDVIQRLEKQVEDLREEKYRATGRPPGS